MMRRSPPGFSCLLGLDQRRKRPLTDMTPEEETTEAGEAGREEEVITLRFSGSRERRPALHMLRVESITIRMCSKGNKNKKNVLKCLCAPSPAICHKKT